MKKISLRSFLIHTVMVIILLAPFISTGCGPTKEEIMAREQAREQARIAAETERARVAEEARKQRQIKGARLAEIHAKEEARLAEIRAKETAGDEAFQQGDLGKALYNYQEVLKDIRRYVEQDERVRQSVIKVVRAMPMPPLLPEETLRSMARGEMKVKMGGAGSYKAAAAEMEQAVLVAPWFADGYFNLGIVQEKANMFAQAIQNFRLYLLAAPGSPNAKAVQTKIYALEVMEEQQNKLQSLAGSWQNKGGVFNIIVDGGKIKIQGKYSVNYDSGAQGPEYSYVFDLNAKGNSLEGTAVISERLEPGNPCNIPSETVPASGMISDDGRSVKINYSGSSYHVYINDDYRTGKVCTGVNVEDKHDVELILERMHSTIKTLRRPLSTTKMEEEMQKLMEVGE
jgi:tetratricopeptide (TPR) repeat protein